MNGPEAFWPNFHQVALYCPDHDGAVNMLKALGYTDWATDEADLVGFIEGGEQIVTHGRMSFNYQMLGGKELEVLTYSGDSHHHRAGRAQYAAVGEPQRGQAFISHMSAHVENAHARGHAMARSLGVPIVHEFETFNHRNPHIAGTKRFREVILGTRDKLGYDLKLIERLYTGPWTYEP